MNTTTENEKACCGTHRGGGVLALLLVFLGAIFLLNNLDLLPVAVWENLWKFWPVLLIAWGLQVLFGKSFFAHLLVMVITIIIVFLLLSYFNPNLGNFLNHWLQIKALP